MKLDVTQAELTKDHSNFALRTVIVGIAGYRSKTNQGMLKDLETIIAPADVWGVVVNQKYLSQVPDQPSDKIQKITHNEYMGINTKIFTTQNQYYPLQHLLKYLSSFSDLGGKMIVYFPLTDIRRMEASRYPQSKDERGWSDMNIGGYNLRVFYDIGKITENIKPIMTDIKHT